MTPEPEAAVTIICTEPPEESILLIRRAERVGDPWSGHWSFPGGRRDPQDPDLLHTALRELHEECGIQLPRESLLTALPHTTAGRSTGPFLRVAPFVFRVREELPTVLDSREAVEALWLKVSLWQESARHSLQSVPGLPPENQFPAILLNGVPLWGFTYRLLQEWLASR
jgi:8-oxo-dGTP pyrophosphatase MutT (NUDIX family)